MADIVRVAVDAMGGDNAPFVTVKGAVDATKEYYYSGGKVYHNNEQADLSLLLEMNPEVSGLIVEYDYYF